MKKMQQPSVVSKSFRQYKTINLFNHKKDLKISETISEIKGKNLPPFDKLNSMMINKKENT
jgi:hypothetical protein